MLANLLRRFGLGKLAHGTVVGTFWQFMRIAGQALWVIVIARNLGPSGYGAFAGIAGLATTLGGIAGLGTGLLLLQNVSRDRSAFDVHWRQAMLTTLLTGLGLAALFSGIAHQVIGAHSSTLAMIAIGLSELVCFPLVYAASFAFQAHERLGWSTSLAATMSAARLVAVVVFAYAATSIDLECYAWFHLAASVATALYALAMVHLKLRPKRARFGLSMSEIREGLSFSAVWFTGNAVTELDKTLALRLGGSEIAGIYSAAYRLVSALTLPVASLAMAAQPRLFRLGNNQSNANPQLIRHLAFVATVYGLAASAALLLLAGVLPTLLGQAFESAAMEARLLVLVPPLYALRLIGSTVLMTSGQQLARVLVEGLGVALLIGLAFLWIPRHGLAGVAATVTATEAVLAASVWALLERAKRQRRWH